MRKKIFATLMSVAMIASFMPSMAFAAVGASGHTHDYVVASGSATECTWENIKTLSAENAKYVKVVAEPTHEKAGKAEVTCKDDYCKNVKEVTITALPTNANMYDHKFSERDLTLKEYADAMHAQNVEGFKTQAQADYWVKSNEATKCYVKSARVCSCGYVVRDNGKIQNHTAPARHDCLSYTCVQCHNTIKIPNGVHTAKEPTDKTDANKVSDANCKHGPGYKSTCSTCGAECVWYDETMKTDNAHNYGAAVKVTEAATFTTARTYRLKSGYVAVKKADNSVLTSTLTAKPAASAEDKAIPETDVDKYEYYKLNSVISEGSCTTNKVLGLKCTVCGDALDGATETTAGKHDTVDTEVAATCDRAAYTKKVCKICGNVQEVPKTGSTKLAHNYVVTKVAGNCVDREYYTIKCSTCGKDCDENGGVEVKYNGTNAVVTKKNTTNSGITAVGNLTENTAKATKTTKTFIWTGFTGDLQGTSVIELTFDTTAKAATHKWGADTQIAAASCGKNAVYGKKCTECGKLNVESVYEKAGTALEHNYPITKVAANCEHKAYEVKATACTNCGEYSAANATANENALKAATILGGKHTFDKWVVTKEATVFEEGVKQLECSVCGAKDATKTIIAKKTVGAPEVKLVSKKGKLTVKASAADNATGYEVTYKRAGKKATTKTYTAESISKTYRLLKGKKYTVTVTAFASNGTETVTGAAVTKKITIKK